MLIISDPPGGGVSSTLTGSRNEIIFDSILDLGMILLYNWGCPLVFQHF
jgi:hypothetical protein